MWVKADCRVAHIFIITMEDKRIEELEREIINKLPEFRYSSKDNRGTKHGVNISFVKSAIKKATNKAFRIGKEKGYIEGKLSILENMRYNFVNKKEIEQLKLKLKEQEK